MSGIRSAGIRSSHLGQCTGFRLMPSFSFAEFGLTIDSLLEWKGITELHFTIGRSRRMLPLAKFNGSNKDTAARCCLLRRMLVASAYQVALPVAKSPAILPWT